jgi:hypothetical protein
VSVDRADVTLVSAAEKDWIGRLAGQGRSLDRPFCSSDSSDRKVWLRRTIES